MDPLTGRKGGREKRRKVVKMCRISGKSLDWTVVSFHLFLSLFLKVCIHSNVDGCKRLAVAADGVSSQIGTASE